MSIILEASGVNALAIPIVVIGAQLKAIPRSARTIFYQSKETITAKAYLQQDYSDQDSMYFKTRTIYPSELTYYNKRSKVAEMLGVLATLFSLETEDREVIVRRGLPTPEFLPPKLNLTYLDSSIETTYVRHRAERIRYQYVLSAEHSYPFYNFRNHCGYSSSKHFRRLFERGPCRHHHPLPLEFFVAIVLEAAEKMTREFLYYYKFFRKQPFWWQDLYGISFNDSFTWEQRKFIEEQVASTRYKFICMSPKRQRRLKKARRFFEPKDNVPNEFVKWVEDEAPTDFELPILPEETDDNNT